MPKNSLDVRIVAGMAQGLPRKDVAEAVGISERTLRRRLQEPEMRRAIAECAAEMHRELLGRLNGLTHRALDVTDTVLESGTNPHKLQAAKLILEQRTAQSAAYESALLDLAEISAAIVATAEGQHA